MFHRKTDETGSVGSFLPQVSEKIKAGIMIGLRPSCSECAGLVWGGVLRPSFMGRPVDMSCLQVMESYAGPDGSEGIRLTLETVLSPTGTGDQVAVRSAARADMYQLRPSRKVRRTRKRNKFTRAFSPRSKKSAESAVGPGAWSIQRGRNCTPAWAWPSSRSQHVRQSPLWPARRPAVRRSSP